MYEILRQRGEEYVDHYIYKSRNKANQIIVCEAYRTQDNNINFSFFITTKRKKGYQSLMITGKDGISSLLWAKQCLLDFITFAKHWYPRDTITVYADEKRRQAVYERALLPLGFKVHKGKYQQLILKLTDYINEKD